MNTNFWRNKKVFITGHTGFKGSWLALWLDSMGAEVHGYALEAPTNPALFDAAGVSSILASNTIADIRDLDALRIAMHSSQPDIVFHLAAQSLVRESYRTPVETYAVNVMGTVNVLEAVRNTSSVKAVVNVTTDKCYENKEWCWAYRENEAMGGYDPYSSSKGCSELVSSAYTRSFFIKSGVALATARAGNVIGGGDWAEDRLIPDFFRAINSKKPVRIRAPDSIRPWQHVLEPLSGYLLLAEKLFDEGQSFSGAWNFGPSEKDARSVRWIVNHLINAIPQASFEIDTAQHPHEAYYLKLDSSKSKMQLDWQAKWSLDTALDKVIEWNEEWQNNKNIKECCINQISSYI